MQLRMALRVVCVVLPLAAWIGAFEAPAARARIASLRAPERERAGVGPREQ